MLYPTCLTDFSWEVVKQLLGDFGIDVLRKRKHDLRSIVSATKYVTDNGTKWRNLPNDFPPWGSVYGYFRSWSLDGLWERINLSLVGMVRIASGRDESPSLCSIDSQSQTGEPGIEDRGIDGGKKVNGRKRHIAVDVLGFVLFCRVTAANVSDVAGGQELAEELNDESEFPRLAKILGDNGYRAVGAGLRVPVSIEASERVEGQKGFVPEAFRWAVERTFGWLNRQRRLARNYEKRVTHQKSMNYIGNINICLKRLEKQVAKI